MDDYKGSHAAPGHEHAPLHNLTHNEVYPKDVYSNKAAHYYGSGSEEKRDKALFAKIHSYKDKPDHLVEIHRAIPRNTHRDAKINKGDWVTIDKEYAREHGEGPLEGKYRILSMKVPAKHIHTNGDSAYEWGYNPEEPKKHK